MEEGKGTCKHGEFDLMAGCPECIAERQASEAEARRHIVKVRYGAEATEGREYSYYSEEALHLGDLVEVPTKNGLLKARVTATGVDPAEVAAFKDAMKTIRAGSLIAVETPADVPPRQGPLPESQVGGPNLFAGTAPSPFDIPSDLPADPHGDYYKAPADLEAMVDRALDPSTPVPTEEFKAEPAPELEGPYPPGANDGEQNEEGDPPTYLCPTDCAHQLEAGGEFDNPHSGGCAEDEKLSAGANLELAGDYPLCPLYSPAADLPLPGGNQTAMVRIAPEKDDKVLALYKEGLALLRLAEARVIRSDADVKLATDDLAVIGALNKKLDELKREYEAPIKGHLDAFRATFKAFVEPLVTADKVNREKWATYRNAVKAAALKAKETNRLAQEVARRQAEESGTGEFTVETTPVAVPHTADTVRSNISTGSAYQTPKYRILDFKALPDEYKLPDAGKLTRVIKAAKGQIDIPGVEIYFDDVLSVRQR